LVKKAISAYHCYVYSYHFSILHLLRVEPEAPDFGLRACTIKRLCAFSFSFSLPFCGFACLSASHGPPALAAES